MIQNAVNVAFATHPRMVPLDVEIQRDEAPRCSPGISGGMNGVSLHQSTAPTPSRPGLMRELEELRSAFYGRSEVLSDECTSIRIRLCALESHVFGDGPNAVNGR